MQLKPTLLFDQESISNLLSLDECITAVEAAFIAHTEKRTLKPALLHVDTGHGEFHIKTGGFQGKQSYFATKINGGFFNNRRDLKLPNIIGLIVLFDGNNGAPLAVMESALITRLRTGAATALAAKYLARADSSTVTICGAGLQGEIQLLSLARVLPIKRVFIWSRNRAEAMARSVEEKMGIKAQAVDDLVSATNQSDVIVTCTPAKKWYLGREHVRPGTFIAAIGSDSPDKQEIEPALIAAASIVPDLLEQASQAGDLHHALKEGLMRSEDIRGELGHIAAGKAPKRHSGNEIIIFDSTGTALQDTAAALAIYLKAKDSGGGKPFRFL